MRMQEAHRYPTWRQRDASIYDPEAPEKATNLSINGDLLNKAEEMNLNL